jgi:type I restriction enzyme S subunit
MEMMDNLPTGWTKKKLPQVAEVIMGQSPPSSTYNTVGDGLPFFQGKAEFGNLYPSVIKYCNSPKKIAEAGDVLISVRAPVGPTNLCKEKSCIGRGLSAFRPNQVTTTKYLFYYMRNIESWLSSQGTGSTFTAISKTDLENIEILLPHLNEQRRIVAKLEKLLQKVDACKERLDKIPTILKRFRQSILAAACSGRLTADWREQQTEALPDRLEQSQGGELPPTWKLSVVERLTTIGSGQSSKIIISKCKTEGEIPWFKVSDMNLEGNEKFMLRSQNYLSPREVAVLRIRIFPVGTVIFPKRGGAISTNKKRILTQPSCIDSNTMALTPHGCSSDYFWMWFCTVDLGRLSDGSNVPQINNPDILPLEVPLPPSAEQQEIVRRVEALFKIADQIEERYKKGRAYIDKLTQSILAKAFRGELVPQDTNDEPASELLKRIKTECAVK